MQFVEVEGRQVEGTFFEMAHRGEDEGVRLVVESSHDGSRVVGAPVTLHCQTVVVILGFRVFAHLIYYTSSLQFPFFVY
mgnify:CR=1 FL=1